jgi:tetratricopeptide (TPR) repeat protein
MSLGNLAKLYFAQGKAGQAVPLIERKLSIQEKRIGAEHFDNVDGLCFLAALYKADGKYEQADHLYQRALGIQEKHLGVDVDHPHTLEILFNLASLYYLQGTYWEGNEMFQRAVSIEHGLAVKPARILVTREVYNRFVLSMEREEGSDVLEMNVEPSV